MRRVAHDRMVWAETHDVRLEGTAERMRTQREIREEAVEFELQTDITDYDCETWEDLDATDA